MEKTTNSDRIRKMDDEELAWLFMEFRIDAFARTCGDESALPTTQATILEWLQEPVKEEDQ